MALWWGTHQMGMSTVATTGRVRLREQWSGWQGRPDAGCEGEGANPPVGEARDPLPSGTRVPCAPLKDHPVCRVESAYGDNCGSKRLCRGQLTGDCTEGTLWVSIIDVGDGICGDVSSAEAGLPEQGCGTHLNSYLDSDFSSQAVFPPPKFFFAVSTILCGERGWAQGSALLPPLASIEGATLVHHGGDLSPLWG